MECIYMYTYIYMYLFICKHTPRVSLYIVKVLQATFKLSNKLSWLSNKELNDIEQRKKFQKTFICCFYIYSLGRLAEIGNFRLG